MAAYCMVKIFYFCTVIFVFFFSTNNVFCNDLNLGNLAEIFSTLAGGDGCKFRCPKGIILYNYFFIFYFFIAI